MVEQVLDTNRGSDGEPRQIVVLLVDDQAFVGAAVGRLLATEPDIALHCCRNALDAIALANQLNPTIILQDLVMPDIDGLTLVRLFRTNPPTAVDTLADRVERHGFGNVSSERPSSS